MNSILTQKVQLSKLHKNQSTFRCKAKKPEQEVKYKDPVTRFLDSVLNRNANPLVVDPRFTGEKLTGISLEDLQDRLVEGVSQTNWFVTGNVDFRLFSSDFKFRDPSVSVGSIEEYAAGVARLFEEESEMDVVSVERTGDREIKMVWRLEAILKLPFRPKVKAYYVTTYFRTNDDGLICEQEEFFSIPEWELIASIFFPNLGTPPAPPIDKS